MRIVPLLISVLVVAQPRPVNAVIRLIRWIRGPCPTFEHTYEGLDCICQRKGIFGYKATCSGTFVGFHWDATSSGDSNGAIVEDCLYASAARTTELLCTKYTFEKYEPLRRLFFGPFYGKGTCTETVAGRPCASCVMDPDQQYWPSGVGECKDESIYARAGSSSDLMQLKQDLKT